MIGEDGQLQHLVPQLKQIQLDVQATLVKVPVGNLVQHRYLAVQQMGYIFCCRLGRNPRAIPGLVV